MFDSSRTVPAPPLRVSRWIDAEGHPSAPLKLTDLGEGFKVIYCFQHWCPGCHSHGFPTLKTLVNKLSGHGFGFAAVQTVFEGAQTNTFERLRENQERYGLAIPFGHDAAEGRYPTVMADYRSGRQVNLEVDLLARYLERLLLGDKAADPKPSSLTEGFLAANGYL